METKKVAHSSAKMALATATGRLLGLVRELALANTFGAGAATDAFALAYRIPNMLRDLLAEGALSSSFVPIFVKEHLRGKARGASLFWALFLVLLVMTGLISILIILKAETVVRLLTSESFSSDPEAFPLTITLTKIMAPFLCFVSLSALMMGVLNSLKFFFIPALSPALFNVVMILSILLLTDALAARGIPAPYALGLGVLLGGFLQFLLLLVLVLYQGLKPRMAGGPTLKALGTVVKNMGIGTLGVAATQINVLVSTILATGIGVGAVSWLTYAFRLFHLPIGVLSVSVAGSNLVHFSEAWKKGDRPGACGILKAGYDLSWMTALPGAILLFILAEPSVKILFERGAFDATDREMTALGLKAYAWSIPFYGLYKILAPVFFSLDKASVGVFISLGSIGLNILFCLLLVDTLGLVALPLGTGIAMVFNVTLQIFFLKKFLRLGLGFFVGKQLAFSFFSALFSGVTTFYTASHLIDLRAPLLPLLGQTTLTALWGLVVYTVGLKLLVKNKA